MTTTTTPATNWQHTAPGVFTGPDGWTVVNTQSIGYPWIVVRPDGTPAGPGAGYGYMSAERAQQVADDEIRRTAPTATLPAVGVTARFDLGDGDSYIGEIHPDTYRDLVVLQNYAAWYDGQTAPFNSGPDDTVRFRIDRETTIEAF